MLLTLAGLIGHSAFHRFLTDDAFISFRYARNLAHGHGLVFNPGFERVEGYTDFLWVLILAAFQELGIAPETVAPLLGFAATVVLWGLVAWYALRDPPAPGREWLVLVPLSLLAVTRSVAVWTTSGLETRWFEALVVGGTLRLMVEVEARLAGAPRRPVAVWLFGLAALTRPDGILVGISVLSAAGAWLLARRPRAAATFAFEIWPFVALVAGHFVFRRVYYGEWLPNTYHAKVGGRVWWDAGGDYLLVFALEYAVLLWLPLIAAAVAWHRRRGTSWRPLLFAAVVLPHALYVAAIGGDHFEYRPLDLYFPLAFMLIHDGASALATTRVRAALAAAWLVVVAVGLWQLPWQSHRQFTRRVFDGFPGLSPDPEARDYLSPERDPIYRLPGLRSIASRHRVLLGELTDRLIGVRQEEHRMFLAAVEPEGRRLAELVAAGVLPRDAHVAIDCVGAIPYYSGLRILDRRGLTDARVARSAPTGERRMAHEKAARFEDARERGVELWAADAVHLLIPAVSRRMLNELRDAVRHDDDVHAADVGDGHYLVCRLPQGVAPLAERMLRLSFRRLTDPGFEAEFLARNAAALGDSLKRDPASLEKRQQLAYILLLAQRWAEALDLYRTLAQATPTNPFVWESIALCAESLGDRASALEANRRALEILEAAGDEAGAARVRGRIGR
jgi:hypothetical protein